MTSLARPVAHARWRRLAIAMSVVTAAALGVVTFVAAPAPPASAAGQALVSPTYSPNPNWSTAGDFALDTYGDPWDFSNGEDFPVEVGAEGPGMGVSNLRMSGGVLAGTGNPGSNFSFVYAWETPPGAPPTYRLPWGRDGAKQPIDANRYRVLSFQLYASGAADGAVRWFRADGTVGVKPFRFQQGWNHYDIDLGTDPTWAGTVTTMGIVRGNEGLAPDLQFDWVSLHRSDTRGFDPSAGVGAATVTAPSEAGDGSAGNWSPLTPGAVAVLTEAVGGYDGNGLHATSIGNDPSVEVNLPAGGFDGSRYHRATVSICYDGGFSLSGDPGGGMIGRFAWFVAGAPQWTESQDIIVFPGCHDVTIDLDTNPPGAVHDEESGFRPGFTCQQIVRFRFDPDEDPGRRGFHIAGIRLGQDPSFSSSYPITFHDVTGNASSADLFVSSSPSPDGAIQIARGVGFAGGQGTFTWNGTDVRGNHLSAGSYYVFVKASGRGGSTTTVSSAPVRYDAPATTGLGTYQSITPARILDTRDGTGRGCVTGVGQSRAIDVPVTGVGGVPNGASAVALNVTVDGPTAPGYVTVWPTGSPQPVASNLNFVPGQTVPNLVIAKVGVGGQVSFFNNAGNTKVIADVVGYFTSGGDKYTPLNPDRFLDTRTAGGPVGPGGTLDVQIAGRTGANKLSNVPADATAVAVNVTVDGPTSPGYLTVWPSGQPRPLASSLNFVPGQTVPNLVIAKLGAGGKISIFNNAGATHVIADVVGYFSDHGATYTPLNPDRLLDTRSGFGGARVGQGQAVDVQITGRTGANGLSSVPGNATAVALNVTITDPDAPSFATVWPTGAPRPFASNLNFTPGQSVPNMVIAKLGAGGKISIYNNTGTTDVVADVVGYFTG